MHLHGSAVKSWSSISIFWELNENSPLVLHRQGTQNSCRVWMFSALLRSREVPSFLLPHWPELKPTSFKTFALISVQLSECHVYLSQNTALQRMFLHNGLQLLWNPEVKKFKVLPKLSNDITVEEWILQESARWPKLRLSTPETSTLLKWSYMITYTNVMMTL